MCSKAFCFCGTFGHSARRHASGTQKRFGSRFLARANADTGEPALIKAGLADLWFVTLHPFDDGDGRITGPVDNLFSRAPIGARTAADRKQMMHLAAEFVGPAFHPPPRPYLSPTRSTESNPSS